MQGAEIDKRIQNIEEKVKKLERALSVKLYSATHRKVEPIAKEILNTQEAASYLGIELNYLRNMTAKKQIAFYKPNGKNMYFDVKDLDAWLRRNRYSAQPPEDGDITG